MEAYFSAKVELFAGERSRRGVVLIDDEWGERLARESVIPIETVSTTGKPADWNMTAVDGGWVLTDGVDSCDVRIPVGADFVVANAAVAIVAALRVGVPLKVAADATETASIPGRMELVGRENGIDYVVDYAHTPDAIEQVVSAAAGSEPLVDKDESSLSSVPGETAIHRSDRIWARRPVERMSSS